MPQNQSQVKVTELTPERLRSLAQAVKAAQLSIARNWRTNRPKQ